MNKFPVVGSVKVLVDDSDWRKVGEFRWHLNKSGQPIRTLERGRVKQKMTDLIMNIGAHAGKDVEFINGDNYDFRKENLRIVDAPSRLERGAITDKPKFLPQWQKELYIDAYK